MNHYIEQLVDLTQPEHNRIYNMQPAEARACVLSGDPNRVRAIEGSFCLVARDGKTVRMARSLDRPMRYFLAKREAGPALVVAHRIDAIQAWLQEQGLAAQFHPSYTRMIPAFHITEIQLVGCPDPDPIQTRFFDPPRATLPPDLDEIGRLYIGALAEEIRLWLGRTDREGQVHAPVGVCFSGGIDSGAVFLTLHHVMRRLGMNLGRLKAFTLDLGQGPDHAQARDFLHRLGLGLFLEPVEAAAESLDIEATIRVVEDYKPLDIEAAAMGLLLCRGIRARYPDWRLLVDGDGGDENLKDYPIEENPELTIRSVVHNRMLYQEGWGVGRIKHSLTYSGGLSRSYTRTFAPATACGFEGFSPFTSPRVIEMAEAIPFIQLTNYEVPKLYELKGEVVRRGIRALTGLEMPVFTKRRFQHGAIPEAGLRRRMTSNERELRRQFLSLYD